MAAAPVRRIDGVRRHPACLLQFRRFAKAPERTNLIAKLRNNILAGDFIRQAVDIVEKISNSRDSLGADFKKSAHCPVYLRLGSLNCQRPAIILVKDAQELAKPRVRRSGLG